MPHRRRLILRCHLCDPDGALIEPTSERAYPAAMDHALDHHLDHLTLWGAEQVMGDIFVHSPTLPGAVGAIPHDASSVTL